MLDVREGEQQEVLRQGLKAAVFMGLVALTLFVLSFAYNTTHTAIDEKAYAYPIIGLAVFFHNINRLKASALHGLGRHGDAASILNRRKIYLIAAVLALSMIHVEPSLLVIAFLASELLLVFSSRKRYRFPRGLGMFKGGLSRTLDEGGKGLFTDDALGFVLFLDFLILGIYVPSWELGVYSEATIIGRFFLLVPLGLRPLLSRRYCLPSAERGPGFLCMNVQSIAKAFFLLHALVALYFELFFPGLVRFLFLQQNAAVVPLRIFSYILPGLLLYSAVVAAEPVYEALGKADTHRRLVTGVLVLNLCLNLYLVPYAGFIGAAVATSASLMAYFALFGVGLERGYRAFKLPIIIAGGGVYLVYEALRQLSPGPALTLIAAPVLVFAIVWSTGYFAPDKGARAYSEMKANA